MSFEESSELKRSTQALIQDKIGPDTILIVSNPFRQLELPIFGHSAYEKIIFLSFSEKAFILLGDTVYHLNP